jgi:site-specific DNA-cytosine methylase
MDNIPVKLLDLLQDFDVYDQPGCKWHSERNHVLLDDVQMSFDAEMSFLKGTPLIIEGSSRQMFVNGCFPGHADTKNGEPVMIAFNCAVEKDLHGKMLLWDVKDSYPKLDGSAWTIDSETLLLPLSPKPCPPLHVLEAFSGGYGGWKHGCRFLKDHFRIPMQTVALDHDFPSCVSYAMTHNATLIDAKTAKSKIDFSAFSGDFVIHGDIDDDSWVTSICNWGVHLMTISSPCQPWSSAAAGLGLHSDQGCLLPTAILKCRQFRPVAILLEQVNGFSTHEHKAICLKVLKHVGYQLAWQRVIDAAQFGATTRIRWLALAINRHTSQIQRLPFKMWPDFGVFDPVMLDAVFTNPVPDFDSLHVTQLMLSCAKDTTMLPPFMKKFKNCSGDEILKARISLPSDVQPTVMAKYGQQHLMTRSTLENKGYYGHFLDHEGTLRLWHPAELQMSHITYGEVFYMHDLTKTWTMTGNMITCPHAVLLLANAINMLPELQVSLEIREVFDALFQNRLRVSECRKITGRFASMFVRTHDNSRDWIRNLANFDILQDLKIEFGLPDGKIWIPSEGLIAENALKFEPTIEDTSQITTPAAEETEDPTATMHFQPMLRIKVKTPDTQMIAWTDSEVAPHELIHRFNGQVMIEDNLHAADGFAFVLKHATNVQDLEIPDSFATPCIQQENMIFPKLDRSKTVAVNLADKQLECVKYDQFGIIGVAHKVDFCSLLLDFKPEHEQLDCSACFILAAFRNAQISVLRDYVKMQNIITIYGGETERKTLASFWHSLFTADTMKKLHATVSVWHFPEHTKIAYGHLLPIPPDAFETMMTIAAAKRILDSLHQTGQTRILIKWKNRTVWDGNLPVDISMTTISALLQIAFFPTLLGRHVRIVYKAKQRCDMTVAELKQETLSADFLLLQLVEEMSGGTGGAKDSQKSYLRNSIAATLLEEGYSLDWVASTTEAIISQVGMKSLLQVTKLPPGKQRIDMIMQICEDCSIAPPTHQNKAAMKTAQKGANRVKKRVAVEIDPKEYKIEPIFFLNQADEPIPQLSEVSSKATGVVLLSINDAIPWLREGQRISSDCLAIVIPGTHEVQTSLEHAFLTVPCKDAADRPVILKATIVQLGDRLVKTQVCKQPPIDEQACATVAVTLWREDWQIDEWSYIVDHPFTFVRQQLIKQGHEDVLQATWGKSLRLNRQPTTAQHATSVQFHATVPQEKLKSLLVVSGFNRIWLTPKDKVGRLDASWRIIWLEGSWAHLNSQASKTPNCAGLVRSKSNLGLRFAAADFESSWKLIFPDKPAPKGHESCHLFQVQSLPYGCTADMLTKWSTTIGWEFRAMKALGPNSWLVGSKTMPQASFFTFNSKPVLVKFLPPKDVTAANPIIAGPKPQKQENRKSPGAASETSASAFDPWAQSAYNRGLPPAFTKDLTGPTESRLQEQDGKIEKLEVALEQLRHDTKAGFEQVQQRELQAQKHVQDAIHSVKSELENAFQSAIVQQSNQLNGTLNELRSLLISKSKRSREAGGEEEDMEP